MEWRDLAWLTPLGPILYAGDLAEGAGEQASELATRAGERVQGAREGFFGDTEGLIRASGDAAREATGPFERMAMWLAIGLIAITVMVVVGALVYFTWPIMSKLILGGTAS